MKKLTLYISSCLPHCAEASLVVLWAGRTPVAVDTLHQFPLTLLSSPGCGLEAADIPQWFPLINPVPTHQTVQFLLCSQGCTREASNHTTPVPPHPTVQLLLSLSLAVVLKQLTFHNGSHSPDCAAPPLFLRLHYLSLFPLT